MPGRTNQQNKSLHKWLRTLADELDSAGYSFNDGVVLKVDISFTMENLKEYVVHPVMYALYPDVESTSDLDTKQIQEVYLHVDRAISERTGVTVPWPSHEHGR